MHDSNSNGVPGSIPKRAAASLITALNSTPHNHTARYITTLNDTTRQEPPLTTGTVKTLVDSGGYTAWRQNKTVDLDAYCAFLEENADWITHYAVLDHIAPDD